ncbi:Ribulose-phosphate 3 epimerase family protein [uncultured archaeon]|nr:Ribulose-phosphate 3 epimerase family protein [uncultured archaeon]
MVEIIPAILVKDAADFAAKIAAVAPHVKRIQIDIMDGKFVPNETLAVEEFPPIPGKLLVEYHLMVENPLEYVRKIGKQGAIYEMHIESLSDVDGAIFEVKRMGGRVALAISPDTPVEKLEPYLQKIEHVLVMTVYPGFSGQSYLPKMEEKMRWLKERGVVVEVDGGVGMGSAKSAAAAGATLLDVASAIFSKPAHFEQGSKGPLFAEGKKWDARRAIEELKNDAEA